MGIIDALKRRRGEGVEQGGDPTGSLNEPSITTVVHHGSGIGLRQGYEERYIILHRNVFPGVLTRIRASNIRNYSIFLAGGKLFSHYEYVGKDYAGDMAAMGDPITKDWWKLTDPMQSPMRGRKKGEWWTTAIQLGHFGGDVFTGRGLVRGCVRTESGGMAGEKGKRILDAHHKGIAAALRRTGFRNVGVFQVGGWVHCYYEQGGADLAGAEAVLAAEPEVRSVIDEFRALIQGGGKRGKAIVWEPMREVFHTD